MLLTPSAEIESVIAYVNSLPPFSKKDVDWAEAALRAKSSPWRDDGVTPWNVVDNWRAAHQVPLARMRPTLETVAKSVFPDAVVVSRLKRAPTILDKLFRVPVRLWNYQDIGGLRAIVGSVKDLAAVAKKCEPPPGFEFVRLTDYMADGPKDSGYGGLHLIYSYLAQDGEDPQLTGLKIEVQIRTRWQHAWATAQEIVDFITGQGMKFGRGDPEWTRFFELMGSVVADIDGYPRGKNVPKDTEAFRAELVEVNNKLHAIEKIAGFSLAPSVLDDPAAKNSRHFVLTFDIEDRKLSTMGFTAQEFGKANDTYREREKSHRDDKRFDTVLVSADSIEDVRAGLPNYVLDSIAFTDLIAAATGWKDPKKNQ